MHFKLKLDSYNVYVHFTYAYKRARPYFNWHMHEICFIYTVNQHNIYVYAMKHKIAIISTLKNVHMYICTTFLLYLEILVLWFIQDFYFSWIYIETTTNNNKIIIFNVWLLLFYNIEQCNLIKAIVWYILYYFYLKLSWTYHPQNCMLS